MPRIYSNMVRATYQAGFPLNWNNAGDNMTHQLPADLTNLCEDLVERIYKRFKLAGKSSESLQGTTTSWRNELDAIDLRVIENYRRVGNIF